MKLTSWNVNGLRAALGKGLLDWIAREEADVVCLQEIKAMPDQVEVEWPAGYSVHWNPAERKGYSGTLTLCRLPVRSVDRGLGSFLQDHEGRVLTLELPDCFVVNCYTPNTKRDLSRLPYREHEWDPAFGPTSFRSRRASRWSSAATSTWPTRRSIWPTPRPTSAIMGSRSRNAAGSPG